MFVKCLKYCDGRKKRFRTFAAFRKWLFAFALLFCFAGTHAQPTLPADTAGRSYTETLSRSYPIQNELFLVGLKAETTDKKLRKQYESTYESVFKAVNEEIKDGQMIHIPVISDGLEKILLEIKTNNPAVRGDLQIFLLRSDVPNAYTLGDNSLFVSLGLFYYLENEDQVAGVLSHEIAHLLLKHTLKAVRYNYESDQQSVADVRAMQQNQVNKAGLAFDLLKSSIYRKGKIIRDHELQADSAGYALLKNTGYREIAFVEALELMERYDTSRPDGLAIEAYKRFFDLPDQRFEDKWLDMEDFSSYDYTLFKEKLDKDSVSSHPKIRERIQVLKNSFPELAQPENTMQSGVSGTFREMRSAAEKQRMPNLFFNEQYGKVIYLSLLRLQNDPDNASYRDWLGKGFQKIFEARRDYQLNKYLDRITPQEQSKSYMQFLSFMWNLKLEEIKKIAAFYAPKE